MDPIKGENYTSKEKGIELPKTGGTQHSPRERKGKKIWEKGANQEKVEDRD